MDDLPAKLAVLAADPAAPEKLRQRAKILRARLMTPIKIGVCGPDTLLVAKLVDGFPLSPEQAVLVDDVAQADIALWCTRDFGPDEVAFWDHAPASLQDHSLLVGPPSDHIQEMGDAYFRQSCTADSVIQILTRQIAWGKDADADQAFALLARYGPVQARPVVSPQQEDSFAAYLQTQADTLAALDVRDTPKSCAAVLDLCLQTVNRLSEMVTQGPSNPMEDAVFDAVDAITLMSLEGDIAAATQAVDVLIVLQTQFKKRPHPAPVRQMETIGVQ